MRKTLLSFVLVFVVAFGSLSSLAVAQGQDPQNVPAPAQQAAPEKAQPKQPSPEQLEWLYGVVWKKIANTYFNQDSLRKDWAGWQHRYDGKLTTLEDLDRAVKAMTESLGDRWTRYVSLTEQRDGFVAHESGTRHLGMGVRRRTDGTFAVEGIMFGSPAYATVLREGNVIKSINGKDLKGLSQPAADALLLGKEGDKAAIVAETQGKEFQVELTFQETPDAQVEAALIEGNIAYVRLPEFEDSHTMVNFVAAFNKLHTAAHGNLQGIILDLRNNPGGVFDYAVGVASMFLNDATVVKSTTRTDRMVTETAIKVVPVLPWFVQAMPKDNQALIETLQQKPMVVLVNGSTMSAAEVVTGSLKDNGRATILGSTTFGKGVGYTEERLPNGAVLTITSLSYLTPKGFDLNGKGIKPDVPVEQPRAGTQDDQLIAAIEHLKQTFAAQRQQAEDARQMALQPHKIAGQQNQMVIYAASGAGFILLVIVVVALVVRRRRSR